MNFYMKAMVCFFFHRRFGKGRIGLRMERQTGLWLYCIHSSPGNAYAQMLSHNGDDGNLPLVDSL